MATSFNDNGMYKKLITPQTLADIEEFDPKECGFCRDVSGDVKGCKADLKLWEKHVVVVTMQNAREWDKMLKGGTRSENLVKAISGGLGKGSPVKVSLASFEYNTDLLTEGDVLVFENDKAPYLKKDVQESDVDSLVAGLSSGRPSTALDSSFLMVCAHSKRDGRCGYCGPVLTDLAHQQAGPNLIIGKISHIGGHMYAGNVLLYDKSGHDWFGYVTPELLPRVMARKWDATITARWRGRLGYNADGLLALERTLLAPKPAFPQCRSVLVAGVAAVALACFVRPFSRK